MNAILGSKEEGKDAEANKKSGLQYIPPHIDEGEDPINIYGFGLISYFNLIKSLILVTFILTLISFVPMSIYSSYSGYSNLSTSKIAERVSIGNMGYSKSKCFTVGMLSDTISLSCGTGVIAEVVDFGI